MNQLDHVALVVEDIDTAAGLYSTLFGLSISYREKVDEQGVEVAFLPGGQTLLELIQPLDDDSGVAKFLAKRGEGLHHIAFAVEDIDAALEALKEKGIRLIDEEARGGAAGHRIAFIHPKAAHGVLIELVEHQDE